MKNYAEIISKVNDFPTLPTIYSSLLEVISNPLSTVQDVADIISKDPAATSKLLKVVNSPIYGISSKIDTITQAIFYLGFNEVKNVILALSVLKIFNNTKSFNYFNFVDLWKHSIAVGIITRILGQKLSVKNVENYFISGLLHDIGKLVLYKIIGEDYSKILRYAYDSNVSVRSVEKFELDISHDIAGEIITESWKLPFSIANAAKEHSNFKMGKQNDLMNASVYLANIIANMMKLGNSGNNIIQQPDYEVWNVINLPEGTFPALYFEIYETYQKSQDIFSFSN